MKSNSYQPGDKHNYEIDDWELCKSQPGWILDRSTWICFLSRGEQGLMDNCTISNGWRFEISLAVPGTLCNGWLAWFGISPQHSICFPSSPQFSLKSDRLGPLNPFKRPLLHSPCLFSPMPAVASKMARTSCAGALVKQVVETPQEHILWGWIKHLLLPFGKHINNIKKLWKLTIVNR
jgi:hypothetical protein